MSVTLIGETALVETVEGKEDPGHENEEEIVLLCDDDLYDLYP